MSAGNAGTGTTYENYPRRMVAVAAGAGIAVYAFGIFLMSRLGAVWGTGYAVYCLWMEWRVLRGSCRSCYYYGKRCAFGKGRICALLFGPAAHRTFSARKITWLDIAPDFLVTIIPLAAGITLLVRSFSWPLLIPVVVLAVLGSAGTGFVRSRIACRYCRQRELACPAEQLFSKTPEDQQSLP